jgi:hypothetical protein
MNKPDKNNPTFTDSGYGYGPTPPQQEQAQTPNAGPGYGYGPMPPAQEQAQSPHAGPGHAHTQPPPFGWHPPQDYPGYGAYAYPGAYPPGYMGQPYAGIPPYGHYAGPPPGVNQAGQGAAQNPEQLAASAGLTAALGDIADKSGLSMFKDLFNWEDGEFWKGAMVGAAVVLLLTNENLRDSLFSGAAKTAEAVKSGLSGLSSAETGDETVKTDPGIHATDTTKPKEGNGQ